MDLDKTEEAKSRFEEIKKCTYTPKTIGSSNQQEYMTCDCQEHWDSANQKNLACGDDSSCINRVTSVECVNGHCLCGTDCQNQRFQKRQYASVSVFQTELKGYGLRANQTIPELAFIYEYIGEVIDETTFRARMLDYDKKNFKHFYFMMLKQDSFIDATIKGSLARFCNHSCNPNAYVDKWVVGDKLRMGIFAKRAIQQNEEITFDYNVDRYGAQSQPCYCGEPNCVKFMGGKTQTDAALLLPDGISEALGVTAKQEKQWLKENKHLRAKQQAEDAVINEMFIKSIEVQELTEADVSKVMGALMKPQDIHIVRKLIQRIYMTNDASVNSLIVRFHGYKTLSTLIKEFRGVDDEMVLKILTILSKWPKVTRNKISSSQIENVVKDLEESSPNDDIKALASELLQEWGNLQMAYRIPKTKSDSISSYGRKGSRSPKVETSEEPEHQTTFTVSTEGLPDGWEMAFDENTKSNYYYHRELNISRWDRPTASVPTGPKIGNEAKSFKNKNHGNNNGNAGPFYGELLAQQEEERLKLEKEEQFMKLQEREKQLQELIKQSGDEQRKKQIEERNKIQEKLKKQQEKLGKSSRSKSSKHKSSKNTPETLEKKWTHVMAKHIPNCIKKYEAEIGRDNIKGCAKDIVKTLVAKELKKDANANPPKELESAKLKKIKEYCTIFMEKFLVKYRAKHDRKRKGDDVKTGDEEAVKKAKI
ncbi:SET domain-containing protein [Suhomyces tanzawaensis NRRL Y-17324]|uniref:Histone-lysine N-methyltransferase, H3 lysine-36 specific n=1 Tax=Suhomyces tanzawaensis NRRL Y-17324 TaxID=984487 RepID=A0A1E4SSP1_9ASCO|nr:SET domain-containing protein [Suhomyces tanzawaensis NRRL Y-17324]ODV82412.1 SET domain-containing protein [Suhomyces tanzawaensis NRRL Y-17324]